MVAVTLPELADLGSREIDHFACDLPTRRADGGKDETDFRQVIARGMPGNVDGAEPEPIRYQPTDLAGLRPKRRGSPARSEEGQDGGPLACGAKPVAMASELGDPHGDLGSECRRNRWLGVCPADHGSATMSLRKDRRGVADFDHEHFDPRQSTSKHESQPAVHDVLRGRAPVDRCRHLGRI